jgi:hypothetical protein
VFCFVLERLFEGLQLKLCKLNDDVRGNLGRSSQKTTLGYWNLCYTEFLMKRQMHDNLQFAFFTGFTAFQKHEVIQSQTGLKASSSLTSGEYHG